MYLDDILVYSASLRKHLQLLGKVFKCLKEANLKINFSKCQFFEKHPHYLGHLISKHGIQLLLEKVSAIKKLKEPSNIDELHHFLGLMDFYRKFIPLYANVTKTLNKLLKKDMKFQCSLHCQAAFKHFKQALCKKSILPYPSMKKCTHCFLTHHYAYSGVITHAVESPEDLRPVAFTLGSFSEMQQR